MSKTQSTHSAIKTVIRSHTDDTPAREREVMAELREKFKDFDYVCGVYETLRLHGEIYTYGEGSECVVKVTEDYL